LHNVKNKITRRELAGAMLATAAVAQTPTPPPAPPPQTPSTPAAELQAARDQNKRSSETLGKTAVPIDTEPAFHFTA
jgi:hypothetical protein